MSRMYIIGVLMSLIFAGRSTAQDITPPDFAYPKTVSKTSLASLNTAISRDDSQQILRSLIDYTLACQAIGNEEMPAALSRIDSVRRVCGKNIAVRSLADLFEAQIYSNIYTSRMYMYDKRKHPFQPMPTDYTEWSGTQFRSVISALLDSSVADRKHLNGISLDKFTKVISQTAETRVYFPSLYDFIATKAAEIMKSWGNTFMYTSLTGDSSTREKILQLYDSQISAVNPCSAPSVRARLDRLAFEMDSAPDMDPESVAEAYMKLYTSMCGSDGIPANEYAGDVLIATPRASGSAKKLFRYAETFLQAYPKASRSNCISNMIAEMSRKSVEISCPTVYGPGMEMTFDVTLRNASKASIKIYNVSNSPVHQSNYMVKRGQKLPAAPVAVLPVETSADAYPYENTVSVSYSFPAKGNYIAVPVIEGVKSDRHNYSKIHITGVTLAMSSFNENRLWAVNLSNGEPLKYVTLQLTNTRRATPVTKAIGKTGADGSLKMSDGSGTVTAILGADKYAAPLYAYDNVYSAPDKWVGIPDIFTSLPIYHPGDTIDWSAVCYEYKGGLRRVLAGKEKKAILYDPSGEAIDSVTALTDNYGRIHSSFTIPSSVLTGMFFISIDNRWSGTHVNVADYKLPTFEVVMDNVERGMPSTGDVILHGKAMTYSGMPLGGCSATLELSVMQRPRWWGGGRSIDIYTDSVTTLPDGSFSIIVPAKALESVPFKNAFYSGTVTVVSSTGESHTATRSFSKGTRYMIHADVANDIDITSGPKSFNVRVTDYMDSTVNIPVNLDISRKDIKVMQTVVTGPASEIDLSNLSPGEYQLSFSLADPALADSLRCQTVMYNPQAKESPVPDRLLWSPYQSMETDGKWLFAVNADTHLNVTIWADGKIISQKWHKAEAGMNRLDVSLPVGVAKGTMTVMCAANYTMAETSVNLTHKDSGDGIEITTESFRDRMVPGETETWKFKIVDKKGLGREAAVIAGMYNTALDAIAPSEWEFVPLRGYTPPLSWNYPDINSRVSEWISQDVKYLDCPQAATAEFNTYGIRTGMPGGGMFTTMYRKNARSAQLMSVTEHSEEVVVEEMAAAMDSDGSTADTGGVRIRGGNAGAAETEDDATAENQDSRFEYRDSETPLAFFRPMLVTDSDGGLVLQFTVPNANARWKFQAIAFTESLLTARLSSAAVSSKPVMVQPNLPRYLRSGDSATLLASVMNNSDDTSVISTTIELFNPSDDRIIDSVMLTDTIEPHANATISIRAKIDNDLPLIGYRIRSSASGHSDGEQTLIPILPAVSPVIETKPFYMAPGQDSITVGLPDAPSDAELSLQFCENPAWYIATALPGLIDKEASTAPQAALSLFSASVAEGLLKEYPAIAEAIREWSAGDKSAETLKSMLSRNQDLKIILLSATPWMPTAGNDTERMSRLALLFDGSTVANSIRTNIDMLRTLNCGQGGWSWCKQYGHPSSWATRKVLTLMGRLCEMGYLPDDAELRGMIVSALQWDNTEASKQYLRNPESDFTSYVRLHDMFRQLKSNPAPDSRIVNSTVSKIVKNWKKSTLPTKAIQAVVLYRNSYPTLARTILGSIREFAKSDPAKGMWFPSLDYTWYDGLDKVGITAEILRSFQLIEPGCKDIEMLAQWLILQKGSQNWGSGEIASSAISAILHSGTKWFVPVHGAEVSVNGDKLTVPASSKYTGEFTMQLPEGSASRDMTIARTSATPAWGATFARYNADMSEITASSCPELSITKELSSQQLHLGEKISVILTLKVNADMDYVCIRDERAACLEPVDQLSGHLYSEGLAFYRENRTSETRIFINHLPKGTYILTYDMWVNNAGTYSSGIATIQSQYAPQFTAHSSGSTLDVTE